MTSDDWPSLAGQLALARRLFGDAGAARVADWLALQRAQVDAPAFARLFSDRIELPGVASRDYNHRLIRTPNGMLLGGVRFYGHDLARPFVEVVAHGFEPTAEGLVALADAVASEWSAFRPLRLRLLVAPDERDALARARPDATVDMTVHAARHADMAPPDGRVVLAAFDGADEATALIARRYADLAVREPDLVRNVTAADPDDVRDWHAAGRVHAIEAGGATVGLLAIAPGAVEWIEGDEVHEEVVATVHAGRGYAASAQAAWAAAAPDPSRLMVGTIDRLNHASRRTAEHAGRGAVLIYAFVPLAR